MSQESDQLEYDLVSVINKFKGGCLPDVLPRFMIDQGIRARAEIIGAEGIGSQSRENKTDVIVRLKNSNPIKISAKLLNADYFGNWYGHTRFVKEFGIGAFERMTLEATNFANEWMKTAIAPFVGVSICFGRRKGRTAVDFLDIFTPEDILTVAKGWGDSDSTANSMYIANFVPQTISGLIENLEEITIETVNNATESFKVAMRPINPMTEGTNRGKNVYTRFEPYRRLDCMTTITDIKVLKELGEFVTIEPNRLNHNHILSELERMYNIYIPRKI